MRAINAPSLQPQSQRAKHLKTSRARKQDLAEPTTSIPAVACGQFPRQRNGDGRSR